MSISLGIHSLVKTLADHLRELRLHASAGDADLLVVDFTDAAQKTHTYADYEASLKAADLPTLTCLGLPSTVRRSRSTS